jgi:RHS repeat-associated protein
MVKTSTVDDGNGAYFKIDYYNTADELISTDMTGYVTGGGIWTRLTCIANTTIDTDVQYGRVSCVLDGTGFAIFDVVKLVPRVTAKYTYDNAGNYLIATEDSLSNNTYHFYDNNTGDKIKFTDARSYDKHYNYDTSSRLEQVIDPLQNSSYYNYDLVNNLVASCDPRSNSNSDNTYLTQFAPNALNQLSLIADPEHNITINLYDRSGNLIRTMLPNEGEIIYYAYDNANRLSSKLQSGNSFTYSYDGADNLISVVNGLNESYTWNYDYAHRVTKTTDPLNYELVYRWDRSNNLTQIIAPDYSMSYIYNNNRVISTWLPLDENRDRVRVNYAYDEQGRLFYVEEDHSLGDQEEEEQEYNFGWLKRYISYYPDGRCKEIRHCGTLFAPLQGYVFTYAYDENGNVTKTTTGTNNIDTYEYDPDNRLIKWSNNGIAKETYAYDNAGNLLTKGSNTYTYNNANEITNQGFTYDDNGNMTSDGTYNYTYDAENQLIQVNRCSDNSLVATYAYNHNGLRRSKTVYTSGQAVVTNFHWDAFGNMVRESDANGNTKRQYYYDPYGSLIAFETPSSGRYYYYHNLRGDVISAKDIDAIGSDYHYDPWGCPLDNPTDVLQPFRYAGYYYDEETGLYYLKSRYYSPTLGRFLTRDGYGYVNYGNPQTLNLYSYCRNNPVNSVDPTGRCDVCGFELNYDLEADNYWNQEVILPTTAMILATCLTDGMAAGSLFSRTGQLSQRINKGADIRVLGHYPEYINLSKEMGAKAFNIPTSVWNKMSPAEQWAANQKFLDRAIAKGAEFVLATPLSAIRKGTFYEKEIQYLMSKGYKLSSDGYKLIK